MSNINIDDLSGPNWWERVIGYLLSHKIMLVSIFFLIGGISFISFKNYRTDNPLVTAQFTSFSNINIEGYYFGRIKGRKSEGFPAKIVRKNNSENNYLLCFHNEEYEFYYNRMEGVLQSELLGEGTIMFDSITNKIKIEFREWIFRN